MRRRDELLEDHRNRIGYRADVFSGVEGVHTERRPLYERP